MAVFPSWEHRHLLSKIKTNGVNYVIEITKKEKEYLLEHGCHWHYDVMSTVHKKHYYARECEKVSKLLDQLKKKGN